MNDPSQEPTSSQDSGFQYPSAEELDGSIPGCEILELAGVGGMGAVYKARQSQLDRLVAVKLLPFDAAELTEEFAGRFKHEARAMAQLNHPNIVTIHDFGRTGSGQFYFIMEYVGGMDLRQLIRAGGVSPEAALELIMQVCDALDAAHQIGVVHRDIKPANILIDANGCAKVTDFGIAKVFGADFGDLTETGGNLGTPGYIAPEQMQEGSVVDARADIYSVGVLLYELLTGGMPQGVWVPPSEKVSVSDRIDKVIDRALQAEPGARYQSVGDVKTDITGALISMEPSQRMVRKHPRARWVAAVAGLAAVALFGWVLFKNLSAGDESPSDHHIGKATANAAPAKDAATDPPAVEPALATTEKREFEAEFDSFVEASGSLRVSIDEGAVDVEFPAVAATAFVDYRRGDRVAVVGEVVAWGESAKRLRGTEVVRLANPLSRVTEHGRAEPPRNYRREQVEWEAFNSGEKEKSEVGKSFLVVGKFSGTQKGADYYLVRISDLFFAGGEVEFECPSNPTSTELFQKTLQPNDEIVATLIVATSGAPPGYGLSEIRRIDGSSLVPAAGQEDLRREIEKPAKPAATVVSADLPPEDEEEFLMFELGSGSEFVAKPISYYKGEVRLESEGGKVADIAVSLFTPDSRADLADWIKRHPSKLTKFDIDLTAARPVGGNTDRIRTVDYTIEYSNQSPIALEGLELEYKMFYRTTDGRSGTNKVRAISEPRMRLGKLKVAGTDSVRSKKLVYNYSTGEILNKAAGPGVGEGEQPEPVVEPDPPRDPPGRPGGRPPPRREPKRPSKPKLRLEPIGIWVRIWSGDQLVTEFKDPSIFSDFRWDADG